MKPPTALTPGTRSRCLTIMTMMIVMAGLWGCDNKEILTGGEEMCTLDVRFLWEDARGATPEGMTLLLYPQTAGSRFWRYDIAGKEGGLIEVAQGVYTLIAVNNDLPGIELLDPTEKTVAAVTRPAADNPKYAEATGMLYEGRVENLAVMPGEVCYRHKDGTVVRNRAGVVDCLPDSMSTVFTVRIAGAQGMERVRSLRAVIEGCARGISLASETPLEDTVSAAIEMDTDIQGAAARGSTTLFLCDKDRGADILLLRAKYHEGRVFEKKWNISQEIKNYPYPHNVEIIINGLNFPEVPQGGEDTDPLGINVGIDGWNVIEIYY